jgi:hypothetical protein
MKFSADDAAGWNPSLQEARMLRAKIGDSAGAIVGRCYFEPDDANRMRRRLEEIIASARQTRSVDDAEGGVSHTPSSPVASQERVLIERWRAMPAERRFTLLALSELLALTPEGPGIRAIIGGALDRFAGGDQGPGHADFVLRKALREAARALGGRA